MRIETHKAAVLFAGTALLLLICGAILLLALDKSVPDWFQALALADLTGLLGLLGSPKEPEVRVTNTEPIPVKEERDQL